jgi:arylsulfatase
MLYRYAYEESLRVPLVIKDPRMPRHMIGTKNDEFTLNLDLAPTILSAAQRTVPEVMQGRDMAPLYTDPAGPTAQSWRKQFFYEFRGSSSPSIPSNLALVRKDSKYIFWEEHNYAEFFNLTNDPYEEFNLSKEIDRRVLQEAHRHMEELQELAKTAGRM